MTSFDVMDSAAFGFGPTRSGLTIRAGRDPLVLVQLLLLMLPLEFSLQALLVLFVFGEVGENKQVTPKYTALVAIVSDLMGPQGLRHLQGHLPHLGKLLGRFGLPESSGTVAV